MPRPAAVGTTLLVRTTALDAQVVAFADALERASGQPVAYVVDERSGPTEQGDGRTIVRVSRQRCQDIGLYCPPGFAWSCGDYGLYLARRALPGPGLFWLIEHDVRLSDAEAADFFAFFAARPEVDLLTSYLDDADVGWHWTRTAVARRLVPKRCFFPVIRLSARAIDVLYEKRLRHSRHWSRRMLWPNDEAMVATTLVDAALVCRDINSFGRRFYDRDTFSYSNLIDGDAFDWSGHPTCLVHPVLYGEQYAAKQRRLAEIERPGLGIRLARKFAKRVNRLHTW